MAKNLIQQGRYLTEAVAGKSSGDPTIVGDQGLHGVALIDTDADGNVVIDTQGVYDLSVQAREDAGNVAIAIGDPIYYEVGGTPLLNAKRSGIFFGTALEAIASGQTDTIHVRVEQADRGMNPGFFKYHGATAIVGGVLALGTPCSGIHKVGGEGAAADDLDSITGGVIGDIIILEYSDATITVKDGTINLAGVDCILDNAADKLVLVKAPSGSWDELTRSGNG